MKMMAQVDVSASPVVNSSEGKACSTKGGACDGFVGSEKIGMGCSGADGIPRWC